MPVHFLDLASAVEKLRWAEKEWRELNQQVREARRSPGGDGAVDMPAHEQPHDLLRLVPEARQL